MLELASVGIVTLHLLAADVAAVGPLVCLWLQWRGARGSRLAAAAGRKLLLTSIAALLVAMALGAAALGLLWLLDRQSWFTAAGQLPARRYWFGMLELLFSLVCMVIVARLRGEQRPGFNGRFTARFILTALAGTNLAYHFPTLFSAIGVLSTRPQAWGRKVTFIQLLVDPEIFARTLHHLLAALVVTGGALMIGSLRWRFESLGGDATEGESADDENIDNEQTDRRRVAVWGGRIALAASVAQLLAGMHLLFQLSGAARQDLMGEDAVAGLLFAGALLTTVMLLHRLAAISFGEVPRRQLVTTVLLICLAMLLMTATARRTRRATSPPAGRAACRHWGANGKLMAGRLPPPKHPLAETTRAV